jgi:adhesin transport system membrane fusion protein
MTTKLDSLLADNPLPSWRALAWPAMIIIAVAVGWSAVAELDEVAVSTGEVVPLGRIKVVQHLEGGIIKEIYVREGDTVKENQPLMLLDLASTGANREELRARLDGLLLIAARVEAEANGKTPDFPADIAGRQPAVLAAQRQTFEARKRELDSTLNVMREQVRQRELEIRELDSKRKASSRNLELAKQRLKMSASLLGSGLTARVEHLKLEAEVESLEGEVQTLTSSLPRAQAALSESQQRQRELEVKFRREAQDEFGKTEVEISRVRELLSKATEQSVRTEVRSPNDGIVKNMKFNTLGGVIRPGDPIMEIVPTGDNLVVESKLNPTDRGYVESGQRALIKISTYDYARYGGLEGEVILVAPDSTTDQQGNVYFRVVVHPDKTYLGRRPGELPITPGMQATVDIHTGTKSVMEYMVKPVLKLRHEAFRER